MKLDEEGYIILAASKADDVSISIPSVHKLPSNHPP